MFVPWMSQNKDGSLKGPFKVIFRQKSPARALALASTHTVFRHDKPSVQQWEKFRGSVEADEPSRPDWVTAGPSRKPGKIPQLTYSVPTLDAISGKSIPVEGDQVMHLPDGEFSLKWRAVAYAKSWDSLPHVSYNFIKREGHEQFLVQPRYRHHRVTDDGYYEDFGRHEVAGSVGIIQEPSLKARWIANPNRIMQHFLRPLGTEFFRLLQYHPGDCTHDQHAGIEWIQRHQNLGHEIASADLSAASDSLPLTISLDLVCWNAYGKLYTDSSWTSPREQALKAALDHFVDVSRMQWVIPSRLGIQQKRISWSKGQPLGTYPSFPLMGLTHNQILENCLVEVTQSHDERSRVLREKISWASEEVGYYDRPYRILGDDVVMLKELYGPYVEKMSSLGVTINQEKSLCSSKVAEFAGRVVVKGYPNAFLKRIRYGDVGDNSFLEVVRTLGPSSVGMLKPRQRKMYETFKYIPGDLVPGSFPYDLNLGAREGIPLDVRLEWYYLHSGMDNPIKLAEEPIKMDGQQLAQFVYLALRELAPDQPAMMAKVIPACELDNSTREIHSRQSRVDGRGDPRRGGRSGTLLTDLEEVSKDPNFISATQMHRRKLIDEGKIEQLNMVEGKLKSVNHPDLDKPVPQLPSDYPATKSRKRARDDGWER